MRLAPKISLTDGQRTQLQSWAKSRTTAVRLAQRAKMILRAATGLPDTEIAARLACGRRTVARWRQRFIAQGLTGIERDALRPGRKPQISARKRAQIVAMTQHERPTNATHWSTRLMATVAKVSESTVRRIWHAHGLKPHLVHRFKLSNDQHC